MIKRKLPSSTHRETASSRLKRDYLMIKRDPVPYIDVAPLPNDLLEWHYVIRGPEFTPYHGGIYHGKLKFPLEYPFKPPSIYMITPSGRFKTNIRLCLSISDFHPDTWNPTWNLSTILTGLLSFMLEDNTAYGSIQTSKETKRTMAKKSLEFNINNPLFVELFPEITEEIKELLEQEQLKQKNSLKNRMQDIGNQLGLTNKKFSSQQKSNQFLWSCLYNLIAGGFLVLFTYIIYCGLNDKSVNN